MAAETDRPVIVAFTLDFETGGLDPTKCACTQIAIHAVRISWNTRKKLLHIQLSQWIC